MRRLSILTLAFAAAGLAHTEAARAQSAELPAASAPAPAATADSVILDMREAFRRGDKARLASLLPLVRGHALEPWAAYWGLKVRLEDASAQDVQDFLTRYAGTYQEDRLRNDWLLLAGKRRDWATFAQELPRFRMADDAEVRCYATAMQALQGASVSREAVQAVRRDWWAQRSEGDGCQLAADVLHQAGQISAADLWMKARLAMEAGRPGMARSAVALDAPDAAATVAQISNGAARYLASRAAVGTRKGQELIVLALIRVAVQDPDQAAGLLDGKWTVQLSPEERNWLWAVIGKQAALKLQDNAWGYFAKVTRAPDLNDDLLAWQARAALRGGQWAGVRAAVAAMSEPLRQDPTWPWRSPCRWWSRRAPPPANRWRPLPATAASTASWRSKNWAAPSRRRRRPRPSPPRSAPPRAATPA